MFAHFLRFLSIWLLLNWRAVQKKKKESGRWSIAKSGADAVVLIFLLEFLLFGRCVGLVREVLLTAF